MCGLHGEHVFFPAKIEFKFCTCAFLFLDMKYLEINMQAAHVQYIIVNTRIGNNIVNIMELFRDAGNGKTVNT